MKKAVSLMMAAAMTMGLAACGSTASTHTAASAADTASSTEAAASTADSAAAADGKVYNIGICQLVQHEALDAATQGFKDALVEKLGEGSVKFDEQNASGDSANCATIVNGFVSNCRPPHRRLPTSRCWEPPSLTTPPRWTSATGPVLSATIFPAPLTWLRWTSRQP